LHGTARSSSILLDLSLKLQMTQAFILVRMMILNRFFHRKMSPHKRFYFPYMFMKNKMMIITKFQNQSQRLKKRSIASWWYHKQQSKSMHLSGTNQHMGREPHHHGDPASRNQSKRGKPTHVKTFLSHESSLLTHYPVIGN